MTESLAMKLTPCHWIYPNRSYHLLVWHITVSTSLSHSLCPATWAENHHNPNLQTRWHINVALVTGSRPRLRGDGSRAEPCAGPGDGSEARPRSGREAAGAASLGARQDVLILRVLPILIRSNVAHATAVRENPWGPLFNITFCKHRHLQCFLAWN